MTVAIYWLYWAKTMTGCAKSDSGICVKHQTSKGLLGCLGPLVQEGLLIYLFSTPTFPPLISPNIQLSSSKVSYSAGMPFSTPHRSSRRTCIAGSILNRFSQNLAQTRPFEV